MTIQPKYRLKLGKTYFNKGFFNLGVDVERHLTYKEGPITILVGEEKRSLPGRISRAANQNGTPRIYGHAALRDWFQANYRQGQYVQVVILTPDRIWIR